MRAGKRLRVLREIYKAMPSIECKGLCFSACASVPVFPVELANLQLVLGRKPATTQYREAIVMPEVGEKCPLLVMGRCIAYEHRPIVCRAYGVAAGLPCPHGCQPSRVLPDEEQVAVFKRVEELGAM